jgi:hypothetical protein
MDTPTFNPSVDSVQPFIALPEFLQNTGATRKLLSTAEVGRQYGSYAPPLHQLSSSLNCLSKPIPIFVPFLRKTVYIIKKTRALDTSFNVPKILDRFSMAEQNVHGDTLFQILIINFFYEYPNTT